MVQAFNLPTPLNQGSNLGQALGQGIQAGSNTLLNQQFQRSQLQSALNSIGGLNQQSSPFDVAKSLLSATAGLPDQGKIVSALYQPLLTQLKNQTLGNVSAPGAPGQPLSENQPGIAGAGQQVPGQGVQQQLPPNASTDTILQVGKKQFPDLPEPALTPDLFQGTLEPTALGLGPVPKQYTPEQISEVERADLLSGLPESPRAKFMQNYNDRSRDQLKDFIAGAAAQSQIGEASAKRQAEFRDVLGQQLGNIDASDAAVAETIANRKEFKNIANDKIRAEQVAKEFRQYQAARDEFNRSANRPNPILFPKYNAQMETLHDKSAPLMKYGQRDKAIQALANQGWSESEISKILNPLSKEIETGISKLPTWEREMTLSPGGVIPKKTIEHNKKVISDWENFLKKNLKSGDFDPKQPDVFKPGTSLLLLRNRALAKGMGGVYFDRLLNRVIKDNDIKLDPTQQRERQFMGQDPTRVWSIYEFLFGGS